MASVRKRHPNDPKSPWVVNYTDQGGKRRLKTFEKKKDADRYRQKVEAEIEGGVHVAVSQTLTFSEAASKWLDDCERRHKALGAPARSTIKLYEGLIRLHLTPRFGRTLITELRGQTIRDYLLDATSVLAFNTVKHLHMVIREVLRFGVLTGYVKRNVVRDEGIRAPGTRKRISVPSREELGQLVQALERRDRCERVLTFMQRRVLVLLALFGGMRVGEICGLMWENVSLPESQVAVRHSYSAINGLRGPKTEAGRRDIDLAPPVLKALVDLWEYLGEPTEGYVLQTGFGGNMRQGYDATLWRPLMKKAGLMAPIEEGKRYARPLFHFHALRHAAVSLLLEAGVPAMNVANFAGHKNANITLSVYAHLFPGDRTAGKAMPAISSRFALQLEPPKPVHY